MNHHEAATVFGMNQWAFGVIDAAALFFAAVCAVFYLNQRHYHLTNARAIAIVVISGCALGRAFAYVWPGDYHELIPWLRLGIDCGLAAVFGAMAWGRIQALFGEPPMRTFHKTALELAVHARTQEEYEMARIAAAAALRQDGIDRRVGERPDREDVTIAIRH